MLSIHDFQCRECHVIFEALIDCDERTLPCDGCWGVADRIISAPTIHTLETHFRGYRDTGDGKFVPSFGEFRDENIYDRATGQAAIYSSPKEKERALRDHGLFQKEPVKKRQSKRTLHFTGQSKRASVGG